VATDKTMSRFGLAFLLALGAFFGFGALPKLDQLSLSVLDIGQGDAIYMRLPTGDDVVMDAGPNDRVLSALGEAMPIGDRTIELLIVSHNHADHIGGLDAILDSYTVKKILISGAIHTTDQYIRILGKIQTKQVETAIVQAGDSLDFGESKFTILHPVGIVTGDLPDDQHNATIVTKLSFRNFCAILTGDIDAAHEQAILEVVQTQHISIRCDVLKVTHHGSRTGSSDLFLQAVQPKIALIPVGTDNRYGHPTQEALDRLLQIKATTFRTDIQGTITVTTNGDQFWTKTSR
jgi:competence protein ComEC